MTATNREERDDMVTLHSPVTAEQLAHLKPGDPVELQGDGSILTGDLARHGCKLTIPTPPQAGAR